MLPPLFIRLGLQFGVKCRLKPRFALDGSGHHWLFLIRWLLLLRPDGGIRLVQDLLTTMTNDGPLWPPTAMGASIDTRTVKAGCRLGNPDMTAAVGNESIDAIEVGYRAFRLLRVQGWFGRRSWRRYGVRSGQAPVRRTEGAPGLPRRAPLSHCRQRVRPSERVWMHVGPLLGGE